MNSSRRSNGPDFPASDESSSSNSFALPLGGPGLPGLVVADEADPEDREEEGVASGALHKSSAAASSAPIGPPGLWRAPPRSPEAAYLAASSPSSNPWLSVAARGPAGGLAARQRAALVGSTAAQLIEQTTKPLPWTRHPLDRFRCLVHTLSGSGQTQRRDRGSSLRRVGSLMSSAPKR